jgi:kynureninase
VSASESAAFDPGEEHARELDSGDALAGFRARFHLPRGADGRPLAYLCGHSLGLQPVDAAALVQQELEAWARRGVDGHFSGAAPWYSYHELVREPGARLVGARPGEVVMMNGLTVNLHLMLVSFYRPTAERHCILMEDCAFPSDTYAVQSQLRLHGHDPARALLVARPPEGQSVLPIEDLEGLIERRGREIALVLLGGVNYYTGQAYDLARVAAAARRQGCSVGYDLAHAAGNLPLALHDWQVDFAVWCSYKYLNAGPGAVAGAFVHERHARDGGRPRLAGWWGNDPARRFRMHLEREFVPFAGAEGWQLSNPPILSLAPLRASLAQFEAAGLPALRAKSLRLTGYLLDWVDHVACPRVRLLTPREPQARGCQLSLRVGPRAAELVAGCQRAGVVVDHREPDVIRAAPVPLYNSYHDVWRFGRALAEWGRSEPREGSA